jgi:hypothetical protein
MFLEPIDPKADGCPDYFDVVVHPMDLGTVLTRLRADKYNSIVAWKADVELVWSNSLLYNHPPSLMVLLTTDLQKQFRDLTKNFTDSVRDTWKLDLIEMHQELMLCIREIVKLRMSNTQKVQRPVIKRDQLYPVLEELPPAKHRRHVQCFSKEDLLKLTNDLNSIKEESQLALIASLLKKHEPDMADDSDQMEIDINLLQPATLHLIRDQVDQIMHS